MYMSMNIQIERKSKMSKTIGEWGYGQQKAYADPLSHNREGNFDFYFTAFFLLDFFKIKEQLVQTYISKQWFHFCLLDTYSVWPKINPSLIYSGFCGSIHNIFPILCPNVLTIFRVLLSQSIIFWKSLIITNFLYLLSSKIFVMEL